MRTYTYAAAAHCETCGENIVAKLEAEGKAPDITCPNCDRTAPGGQFIPFDNGRKWCQNCNCGRCAYDAVTYDSGDFPKGPDKTEESDSPDHCGTCGIFLKNPLTNDGMDYLMSTTVDAIESGQVGDALKEWVVFYNVSLMDVLEYAEENHGTDT